MNALSLLINSMKVPVIIIGLGICLFSCNTEPRTKANQPEKPVIQTRAETNLEAFRWAAGTWQMATPEGMVYEQWKVINDSLYLGSSYMLQSTDTILLETMRLEKQGEDILYIPTIKNENGGQPVTFKLISSGSQGSGLVFENKEHDFPQRIVYKQQAADTLYARIEGTINGKLQQEAYILSKVR